jgi:hypothetical protein
MRRKGVIEYVNMSRTLYAGSRSRESSMIRKREIVGTLGVGSKGRWSPMRRKRKLQEPCEG